MNDIEKDVAFGMIMGGITMTVVTTFVFLIC